jgi:hypothetical protein
MQERVCCVALTFPFEGSGIDEGTLPDKWYCEMNTFEPARANCSAEEEKEQQGRSYDAIGKKRRHGLRCCNTLTFIAQLYLQKQILETCESNKN